MFEEATESISEFWNQHGFTIIVVGSLLFFAICWLWGFKPRKGASGGLRDYADLLLSPPAKPRRKRDPKKTENKCREIVEDLFGRPFPSMRPDFLRNPETGKNLECDMMNPDLKICIERNGEQHYKQVEHFHDNPEAFQKQLQRDLTKKRLLEENGYTLITIPYTIHYDVLDTYIPHKISQYPHLQKYLQA
jgi:hypothetical protein